MIRHYLRDGTEVGGVSGKLITAEEFKTVYEIINRINERNYNDEIRTNQTSK